MVAKEEERVVSDKGWVELSADSSQFISLCSLLQGAIGEELHAKVACLSSAPSKMALDPTWNLLPSQPWLLMSPSFGIQFCPQSLLVIKSGFP